VTGGEAAPVSIRSCTAGDAAALLAVWRAAGSSPSTTDTIEDVTAAILYDGSDVIVAEREGRAVGTLMAAWDGWRGNFYRLAVLPEERRQGIASALLEEGERRLLARGARRLTAIVLVAEAGATAFWTDAGYVYQDEAGRFTKHC
jgi:ribosomal protein S18 acetylase RimI-like enzyme